MLVPVRCFTCGNLIADRHADYKSKLASGTAPNEVLASLGIDRYCCRRMMLTTTETIRQIIPFYEAIHKRHQEVQYELE